MLGSRRGVYLQIAILSFVVVSVWLLVHFFPVVEFLEDLQQRVIGLGRLAAVFYPLLFAGCNVLLLPGGVLAVGAGFFFGLWWGFFTVVLGNSIAAAISFGLSRWLGMRWLHSGASAGRVFRVLEKAVERDAWKIIFLSQLHPLFPTSLLNYLYGLTRIRFGQYMFWTTIGRMPGLFLYTYLGTLGQLSLNLARGKTHPRIVEYWTWGGAFLATVLLFVVLTRAALRAIRETSEGASPTGGELVHADGSQSIKILK